MTQDIHEIRIQTDFNIDGIGIWVVRRDFDGRRVQAPDGSWTKIDPGGALPGPPPTLRLTDAHGRALMQELQRHYAGTPDEHTVRQDLLHERARRDRLEDHMLSVLGLLASKNSMVTIGRGGGAGTTATGLGGQGSSAGGAR